MSTSAVTSADPNVTYPGSGSSNDPQSPLPGTDGSGNINGCSLPFFANADYDNGPNDYAGWGRQQPNDRNPHRPRLRLGVLWLFPQRQ